VPREQRRRDGTGEKRERRSRPQNATS
jgi:hypothetical protein